MIRFWRFGKSNKVCSPKILQGSFGGDWPGACERKYQNGGDLNIPWKTIPWKFKFVVFWKSLIPIGRAQITSNPTTFLKNCLQIATKYLLGYTWLFPKLRTGNTHFWVNFE